MSRAFRSTLAALGLGAAAASGWVWLQSSAPAPLATPNAPQPAAGLRSDLAPSPTIAPAPRPSPLELDRAKPAVAPTAPAERRVARRAAPPRIDEAILEDPLPPRAARSLRRVAEPAPALPDDAVRRDARAAPAIHPRVAAGYAAYRAGRLAEAREAYARALREEPDNRDALLGLAAVEMRLGHAEAAGELYARRLRADPRDPHAQAGLLALHGAQVDPIATESRIKLLLAANPEAPALYFALGNQYAQQGRWAEARDAYLRACGADAENADFAYNLAVSLDHLRETQTALDHYRRAIALAAKQSVAFDLQAAGARVQQLAR